MGFSKVILLAVSVSILYLGVKIYSLLEVPPIPNLDDHYWGPGSTVKEDTAIRSFKINVPEQALEDLKTKLNQLRPLTPSLEGVQQQYGMHSNLLKEIVEFWKTKYDWRERETFLNKYPQFKTKIQGLNIHFLHVKPTVTNGKEVVPLLLLHGWPGSVREFYEAIPHLTTPQKGSDFVFEVIVPSLPGYGFSETASKPGMGPAQMAAIFKNLMLRLGFNQFYVQGGDWGGLIVTYMASFYPKLVLGMHSTVCMSLSPLTQLKTLMGSFYPSLVVNKKFEHKMYPLSTFASNAVLEMGYAHIQATKPDTLGVALNDSPVGLAAYILEKYTTWTNQEWKNREDGGLTMKFKYSDLLDNVMIYWVTGSIGTSMRLYSEYFNKASFSTGWHQIPIHVPSACARYDNELFYQPDWLLQDRFKLLVHTSDIADGGHFAAFEEPQLFADDVWLAVQKFRDVYKNK